MEIPTASDYLAATAAALRGMRERVVAACLERLRDSSSFAELSALTRSFVGTLQAAGYPMRLLDEDGESMVSYGATLAGGRSFTLQGYWDDDDGPSVACTFRDDDLTTTLAGSPLTGVVTLDGG